MVTLARTAIRLAAAECKHLSFGSKSFKSRVVTPIPWNEESTGIRPFKIERVGHPKKLSQGLSIDVLKSYQPLRGSGTIGKRVRHPPKNGSRLT